MSATNFTYGGGPICFHVGTMIATPRGPIAVESLRVGGFVITADHGAQMIRHIVGQSLHFSSSCDTGKPVQISQATFGAGRPERDMIGPPQHRILVIDPSNGAEVLIAAIKLTHRVGIRQMRGRRTALYYNLLLHRHEVIFADGIATESLLLTPYSILAASPLRRALQGNIPQMQAARTIVRHDPMHIAA